MSTEVEELVPKKSRRSLKLRYLRPRVRVTVDGLFKLFRDGELGRAEEGRKSSPGNQRSTGK